MNLEIDGCRILGCIDTGATKTVITSSALESIMPNYKSKLVPCSVHLRSATNHRLEVEGKFTATFKIGDATFKHAIIVYKNEKAEFLIGNDIVLDRFVNYGSRYLKAILAPGILGKKVPIKYRTDSLKVQTICQTKLLPNTATKVRVKVSDLNARKLVGQNFVVEPTINDPLSYWPNVKLEPTVDTVDANGNVFCIMSNTSHDWVDIPANMTIGRTVPYVKPDDLDEINGNDAYHSWNANVSPADLIKVINSSAEMHDEQGERELLSGSPTGEIPLPPGFDGVDFQSFDPAAAANLSHLSEGQQKKVKDLIRKLSRAFAKSDADIGTTDILQHHIDVEGVEPIAQAYRPVPKNYEDEVSAMIQDLLKLGVITEAKQSSWASNLVIVKKKGTGKLRICCDLRGPNSVSKNRNRWPIRNVEVSFAKLAKAKYVTSLDLLSAYWSIKMDPESSKVTAFYGPNAQHYQWLRMPFGLAGAPHTYSQVMAKVLRGLDHFVFNYFDDVIIFSDTFEEHLAHLEQVIARFAEAGFKINTKKCSWLCSDSTPFEWLGSVIKNGCVFPDEKKVKAITEMSPPRNVKEVQAFIGAVGFHRRHIKELANLLAPLTELIKKKDEFNWTIDHQNAFEAVKKALANSSALKLPDVQKPFILSADASGIALGCTLSQIDDDGEEYICAYASRKFREIEVRNMSMPEKELSAILYGCKTWIYYLANCKFTIRTDARSLIFLKKFKTTNSKISRAALWLSELDYDIQHVSRKNGNTIAICDLLSRSEEGDFKHTTYKALKNPELNNLIEPKISEIMSSDKFDKFAESYLNHHEIKGDGIYGIEDDPTIECDDFQPLESRETIHNEVVPLSMPINEKILNVALTEACFSQEAFVKLQQEDTFIKQTTKKVKEGTAESYFLKKGILMKTVNGHPKVVVPHSITNQLVNYHHGTMIGCHIGSRKLTKMLQKYYFWPGMATEIKEIVRHCKICQYASISTRGGIAMGKTKTPTKPNQVIAIDVITGLAPTAERHTAILTIIDVFTKYCMAIPLREKTSIQVTKAVTNHWIAAFGVPQQIHSDEGETDSKIVVNLCEILGIKKSRTPVYHPASNGTCEAVNKSVGNMIKAMIHDGNKKYWNELLPFMMNAYNNIPHTTTQYSPNQLMFGQEMSHQIVPLVPIEHEIFDKSEYLRTLRTGQELQWKIAHAAIEELKDKFVQSQPLRLNTFKLGDFVLIKDLKPHVAKTADQKGTKHLNRYEGPFRIIKVYEKALLVVHWSDVSTLMKAGKLRMHHQGDTAHVTTRLVHPDQCKPFYGKVSREPIFSDRMIAKFLKDLGVLESTNDQLSGRSKKYSKPVVSAYLDSDSDTDSEEEDVPSEYDTDDWSEDDYASPASQDREPGVENLPKSRSESPNMEHFETIQEPMPQPGMDEPSDEEPEYRPQHDFSAATSMDVDTSQMGAYGPHASEPELPPQFRKHRQSSEMDPLAVSRYASLMSPPPPAGTPERWNMSCDLSPIPIFDPNPPDQQPKKKLDLRKSALDKFVVPSKFPGGQTQKRQLGDTPESPASRPTKPKVSLMEESYLNSPLPSKPPPNAPRKPLSRPAAYGPSSARPLALPSFPMNPEVRPPPPVPPRTETRRKEWYYPTGSDVPVLTQWPRAREKISEYCKNNPLPEESDPPAYNLRDRKTAPNYKDARTYKKDKANFIFPADDTARPRIDWDDPIQVADYRAESLSDYEFRNYYGPGKDFYKRRQDPVLDLELYLQETQNAS